jgi:hypothetical protein
LLNFTTHLSVKQFKDTFNYLPNEVIERVHKELYVLPQF